MKREALLRAIFQTSTECISLLAQDGTLLEMNPAGLAIIEADFREQVISRLLYPLVAPAHHEAFRMLVDRVFAGESGTLEFELIGLKGTHRWVEGYAAPLRGDHSVAALVITRDVTERRRVQETLRDSHDDLRARSETSPIASVEEQLRLRSEELKTLIETGQALSRLTAPAEVLNLIHDAAGEVLDNRNLFIALYDEASQSISFPVYTIDGRPRPAGSRPFGNGATEYVIRTRAPLLIPRDVTAALRARGVDIIGREAKSFLAVPMLVGDKATGVICVQDYEREETYSARHAEILSTFASQAAIAVENAHLYDIASRELAERRAAERRLQALRNIDMTITASLDLRVTLNVILEEVAAQLQADAATVLLLDPQMQTLDYAAGRGFRTEALQYTRLRVGQGHAGRAVRERRIVSIPDLRQEPSEFDRAPRLPDEEFIAYHAAPLVAKGQVKGVLELFHRTPLDPDPQRLDFLEALATQAAIAIDNAELFDRLQRANVDLMLAYDTTLEGWGRALELRDRETEGHTQRVTDLTVRLARALGVRDEELVHLRRGALLHDIGKMGIPDSILLKPGPLTDEEWAVMKQHPMFAFELLAPIDFLRPALDIPYAHHEKWDGSGYPRGLHREQIPLSARIFAVVDVWDALRSDRPYRQPWTDEQALQYIREQAGKHFDPQVAEAFQRLIEEGR